MSSIIEKIRLVTLGTVHDLLDKAVDLNSPSAMRQYVRDLEDALGKMQSEAANQAGQVRTLSRERDDLNAKIALNKSTIEKILAGTALNKKDLARTRAEEVLISQKRLTDVESQLETQKTTSANLDKAVTQLQAKHDQFTQRVRDLERLDRDSKAKEQAAKAMQGVSNMLDAGSHLSIDDIESKMRARNDVASVKLDRAMSGIHVDEDPNLTGDVDALLAELSPKEEAVAK